MHLALSQCRTDSRVEGCRTLQAALFHTAAVVSSFYPATRNCRYYSCLGVRQLSDVFDLASGYVDGVKFAGGSFMVMPEAAVQAITDLCHKHQVRALAVCDQHKSLHARSDLAPLLKRMPATIGVVAARFTLFSAAWVCVIAGGRDCMSAVRGCRSLRT